MIEKDLFGNDIVVEDEEIKNESVYQRFKRTNNYRLAVTKEKCKGCYHSVFVVGNTRNYYKCKLLGISASVATDINSRYVCNKFR